MKTLIPLALLLFTVTGNAQGVFNNTTNSALQKVIEDYPNKFRNIQGDKIGGEQPKVDYKSKIEVPGASSAVVTHYTSSKADSYSWKSDLFESDNFDQSKERFKELFNNIRNTIVKIEGMPAFILNGKYEYPLEDKKSTTINFQLLPASNEMQKLKVDLSMHREGSTWKVVLMVYERDKNDQESIVNN